MSLDIAMGGSTNTILHLLAIAQEAEVDFTLEHMDALSRKVPCLAKVAPAVPDVHIEDVHRAGGIMAILGQLDAGGLLHRDTSTIYGKSMGDVLNSFDISRTNDEAVQKLYKAAPGGVRTIEAFSQANRFKELDLDRKTGVIRSVQDAFTTDGGLAVLSGNIALEGCVVKTAGVDESIWEFSGPVKLCESQDEAVSRILKKEVQAGDIVVIRYEGPKGGPGMQEMLYPTSYLKSMQLGKQCALITDGRFSGGTSGLSIGHVSPEAAEGGLIGLVQEGDIIEINIPERSINLKVDDKELARRQEAMEAKGKSAWQPAKPRDRKVSPALRAYAAMVTNASKGAVRDVSQIE